MSADLAASCQGRSTGNLLQRLDEICDADRLSSGQATAEMGPFGAFPSVAPASRSTTVDIPDPQPDSEQATASSLEDLQWQPENAPAGTPLQTVDGTSLVLSTTPRIDEMEYLWSDDYLNFNQNLDPSSFSPGFDQLFGSDSSSRANTPPFQMQSVFEPHLTSLISPSVNHELQIDAHDVQILLRHFPEHVLGMAPGGASSQRKSPWQTLIMPSALQTFAELNVFHQASHTRLASFYALLTDSAYHLSRAKPATSNTLHWLQASNNAWHNAKLHLGTALQHEQGLENYQDQLLSILAMAMVSVSC